MAAFLGGRTIGGWFSMAAQFVRERLRRAPASAGTAPACPPVDRPTVLVSRKNRATVLVIEADDAIRSTIEWLLSEHGYDVRVARTCAEALTAESAGRLDLVLSDIVAAGPDGPIRVAGKLGARLIFMAGSGDQFIAKRALEREGVWLLPKPFSPAALVKTLEEVLDA